MISIKVPQLGESIVEATVSRWLKEEGDAVAPGETLVELETDKVTVEVPATKAGVLVRRLHQEGDVVKVDDALGEVDDAVSAPIAVAAPALAREAAPAAAAIPPAPVAPPAAAAATTAGPPAEPAGVARSAPAARRLATESGIDVADVPGRGRGGVVSKGDVLEFVGRQLRAGSQPETPSPAPPAPPHVDVVRPEPPALFASTGGLRAGTPENGDRETRERMSTRRRRIAEHLLEAQHATAHLTTFNEIDMSAVEALRGRIRDRIEKEHGVRLSFMPFFVRAACMALREFPMVNAMVDGDDIVYHHFVNMGIAVASDAGLVVPNVKDAERKGMLQVAREIVEIAARARDGKLTMDDLTGGTFTITNGGVFGSLLSTPIINFPQVAILGLHAIQERPVAVAGQLQIRPMMYVALSYDHRIIDGQHAVLFLVRVKALMEEPALMLVD